MCDYQRFQTGPIKTKHHVTGPTSLHEVSFLRVPNHCYWNKRGVPLISLPRFGNKHMAQSQQEKQPPWSVEVWTLQGLPLKWNRWQSRQRNTYKRQLRRESKPVVQTQQGWAWSWGTQGWPNRGGRFNPLNIDFELVKNGQYLLFKYTPI